MALLDSDEDEFDVRRSNTNEQLFEDVSEFKIKEKREKKFKSDERKGSLKNLPWSKPKDVSQEKTPKKSKHNRTKSGSKTPPDSPKVGRTSLEGKRTGKVITSQLQPSPNVKGNRKRYSQLGASDESSENEEELEDGYLLSNKPALDEHRQQPISNLGAFESSNVLKSGSQNVSFHDPPVVGSSAFTTTVPTSPVRKTQVPSFFDSPSFSDDPWRSARGPTLGGGILVPEPVATDTSKPVFQPHGGRRSLPASMHPTMVVGGEKKVELHSPIRAPPPDTFFSSPMSAGHTATPTMVNPWAQSEAPLDWSISDELKQKCSKQFTSLKPTHGLLQGDKAREFFVQSKLPNQELSQIWRLADMDKDNALSMKEFCVAMKLVLMRRKGHDIPSSLPEEFQQLQTEDSFSGNFWQKLSESPQQESDDVTGGSPHSEEALVVIKSEEEAVLVDVGNDDSTGLLVDIGEGSSPDRVSPTQTAPHVAKIISLEEDWPGDHDEDTALVKGHRKTTSEGNVVTETEVKKENKPVRPAPPKPSPRRSKTVREGKPVPPLRPERKGTSNDLTVPTSPPSGDSETAPMIIISSQRAKTTQRGMSPPPTSKKSYTALSGSESSNDSHDTKQEGVNDRDGEKTKFKWRGLKGQSKGSHSPIIEGQEKGHSRSTSLDLNKMLLGEGNTEVLEDMPSATPPKPPPKPQLPPRPVERPPADTYEPEVVPRGRVRAASTGSMTSPVEALLTSGDEHQVLDTSADALLLSQPKPPPVKIKPSRKAPRRPPPPKNKPDLSLDPKDKREVQSTIRSLKENNALLTEVNRSLEDKLLQLKEERIKLERELELAQQKYQ